MTSNQTPEEQRLREALTGLTTEELLCGEGPTGTLSWDPNADGWADSTYDGDGSMNYDADGNAIDFDRLLAERTAADDARRAEATYVGSDEYRAREAQRKGLLDAGFTVDQVNKLQPHPDFTPKAPAPAPAEEDISVTRFVDGSWVPAGLTVAEWNAFRAYKAATEVS